MKLGQILLVSMLLTAAACGDDDGGPATPDAGEQSMCEFAAMPPNANASGTVEAGAVTAGAAEGRLDLPVGSALGAYTARAQFLGTSDRVDIRKWEWSGKFNPSVGIETTPMVKAVAITAGGETVVMVKLDLGVGYDGIPVDVAEALGPEYRGKVLVSVSHSHSGPGHFQANTTLGLGFSRFRRAAYDQLITRVTEVAQAALDARRPARIGVKVDTEFDLANNVTRDRRGINDELAGGSFKDQQLTLVRVDGTDGVPIAVMSVFGMHGTITDADNPLASTDAPGAVELALQESFDTPVVTMHLQGAGGDVSPSGHGGVDCSGLDYCWDYSSAEGTGRAAQPILYQAWLDAGEAMQDSLALEVVTRTIELGPDSDHFSVRGGELSYAPHDGVTPCDGVIYNGDGTIKSPIDEFNAPFGAGLCGDPEMYALFPDGALLGAEELYPYRSCIRIEVAARTFKQIFELDFEPAPVCGGTRTTVSAMRLGDYLFVTLPGEPVTLLADLVRSIAPAPFDATHTVVLGYAQGHIGYLLTADDWLLGDYEPSINVWGPLEGEYIAEAAGAMMALAASPVRDDGAAGGADRWVTPAVTDDSDVPPVDPSPLAGTVPATLPEDLYVRGGVVLASAQPPVQLQRLESAHFVWIGEDPLAGTPVVTLQRETAPGSGQFADVTRRSGRAVQDDDLLRYWTPIPLRRADGEHATHHWVAEWQAVTWMGIDEAGLTDGLGDRAGVPLGRYRFHVAGTGYTLDSQPFEVVAGSLVVGAARNGSMLNLGLAYAGKGGWRLLDLQAQSNKDVPLRGGQVHVVWFGAGGGTPLGETDATVAADGTVSVDAGGDAANVATVVVSDVFGNTGNAPL